MREHGIFKIMYQRIFGGGGGGNRPPTAILCTSCGNTVNFTTDGAVTIICQRCQDNTKLLFSYGGEEAVSKDDHHVPDELLIFDRISPADEVFVDLFDKQKAAFWSDKELVFSKDATDLDKLTPKQRKLFEYILAFFATADGEVLENAVVNFLADSETLPIRMAYSSQVFFESIHIKTYASAMQTYIPESDKRMMLAQAFKTDPLLKERDDWMTKYINSTVNKAKRLVAFSCAEGLFFMSAFMIIAWLRSRELFPIFARANEFIARDEWFHVQIGTARFKRYYTDNLDKFNITQEDIMNIVKEAVDLEIKFASSLVPSEKDDDKFDGLKLEDLVLHIQNLGNEILRLIGFRVKLWDVDPAKLPPWVKWIEIQPKSSFYETTVTSYTTPKECSEEPMRDEDF